MIWLTWRQFRAQAIVVYAALGALTVLLAATGAGLADLAESSGSRFFEELSLSRGDLAVYNLGFAAVLIVPAIVGVFLGAPLVARELEAGTHRLAWNQTVTRTHWLAIKVGLTGLVALAGVAVLTLALTWWAGPIDTAISNGQRDHQGLFGVPRMSPPTFGTRGIVPIGYTAFAFALGVTAGTVIRRTVPAMAVTLAVFVAVQIVMPTWIRPHISPTQITTTLTADNLRGMSVAGGGPGVRPTGPVEQVSIDIDSTGAWVFSNETVDAAGKVAETLPNWVLACGPGRLLDGGEAARSACFARLAREGYRQRVTYQPASRFWTLQVYETAIFTGLALLLIGFCFWWVRHRLT